MNNTTEPIYTTLEIAALQQLNYDLRRPNGFQGYNKVAAPHLASALTKLINDPSMGNHSNITAWQVLADVNATLLHAPVTCISPDQYTAAEELARCLKQLAWTELETYTDANGNIMYTDLENEVLHMLVTSLRSSNGYRGTDPNTAIFLRSALNKLLTKDKQQSQLPVDARKVLETVHDYPNYDSPFTLSGQQHAATALDEILGTTATETASTFTFDEIAAVRALIKHLNSDNGYEGVTTEYTDVVKSATSKLLYMLADSTMLSGTTRTILKRITEDPRHASTFTVKDQAVAGAQLDRALVVQHQRLQQQTNAANETAHTQHDAALTDDERLFTSGLLHNLVYMNGTVGEVEGDAREPIINGLTKLGTLFSGSDTTALLSAIAVMVEYRITIHVGDDERCRTMLRQALARMQSM